MARYVMRQRWLALADRFVIRDDQGRDAFRVDGRIFSIGDRLTMSTPDGTPVCEIDQRVLSWGPTYEILRGGRVVAQVRKKLFTFFRAQFTVDVPGPDDPVAQGDFLEHEYEFRRGDRVIAQVSKRWFAWTDTYGIDVADGEDDVLVLAAAVVIDCCLHDEE
jgi:uncharacterized protein YxjI